jgi:hypothetical protein
MRKMTTTRSVTKHENYCQRIPITSTLHQSSQDRISTPSSLRNQNASQNVLFLILCRVFLLTNVNNLRPHQQISVQVSKIMADAISKGIKSSPDSKKSGFSNNVEERLKVLGSFTGVRDDGEEVVLPAALSDVCKQFYQEKNKTAATRIFQNAMKAGAIAMKDKGGNKAANNLIFHTGQFTQVFVNHMKNFHFMTSHLRTMLWNTLL